MSSPLNADASSGQGVNVLLLNPLLYPWPQQQQTQQQQTQQQTQQQIQQQTHQQTQQHQTLQQHWTLQPHQTLQLQQTLQPQQTLQQQTPQQSLQLQQPQYQLQQGPTSSTLHGLPPPIPPTVQHQSDTATQLAVLTSKMDTMTIMFTQLMSNLHPRQEIPSLSTTATLTTQNTTVTQNNNFTQNNDTIYNQLSAPAAQQSQAQAANGDSLPHCLSSGQSSIRRRAEARRLPLQWSSDDEFDRSLGPGEISTDDESEAYASNRKNPEIKNCTKIHLEKYDPDNKEEDFSIWISQFEEAINQRLNPHSQRRHYIACKRWLPSLLKTDAYSVWSRAEYKDSDWPLLKQELAAAFEDSSVRAEWRTSLKAYMWDERNQTLQSYCAKVKHLVDTFETEMVGFPKAIKAQYFLRFINGLPDDYAQHIKLSLPPNSTDIDKAMDVCTQWQFCKSL